MRNLICLALAIQLAALLAGCGTKGPLYIPEQRYPQEAEKAPSEAPNQAAGDAK